MDALDHKIVESFPGKIVRKDLTAMLKRGANVPTFVLEYLLGMYCATTRLRSPQASRKYEKSLPKTTCGRKKVKRSNR